MELWDRRERIFAPWDKYRTFPRWISSSHTSIGEPIGRAPAGSRPVKNRVNWTTESGLCPEYPGHETEKQRALMERQRERGGKEMMVQRGDLRNQWQPATMHYRREKDKDGFGANSYGELEEWARRCYYHSLPRRRRLQGEMWSEIQNALKAERILSSAGRSVHAEPSQSSGVNISENKFNLVASHPPYAAVKHDASGKRLKEQSESNVLSSSWSRPPNYTPPPPYTSRPNSNRLTGTLTEPDGSFPNLSMEYEFGSRPHNARRIEHRSVLFSDKRRHIRCSSGDGTPGTVTFPGPDRAQHQQDLWPSVQPQVKNQQQVFTPQSAGHHENYQTPYSAITLTKPKRRRSGGTVFCLVSHVGELTGMSISPNDKPLTCQSPPLLKGSTPEQVQLADEADSCPSLPSFNLDPTPEEHREEAQNQGDQNLRLSKRIEELRKEREELRKQSTEKRRFVDLSKKKSEDTDSNKDKDIITPAVSSKSTTQVAPQHQTTLKFPLWKEPKSLHCSNGVLEKKDKPNRSISREGQYEQSKPRNDTMTNENTGHMVIDATCVVIKVEFIAPPEKEHIQYVSSRPPDSSKQSSDSNHEHRDGSSVHKFVNQTKLTPSKVRPKRETVKERAERILGTVLQNSFNEAYTLEETSQMENSRFQQIQDTAEGSAEAELESWLKAECKNSQIPITFTPNEEETPSSTSEAEAMLEISKVTHGDGANAHTGLAIMTLTSTKQENEPKSVDMKFMLDEKIPTTLIDIKEKQEKHSSDGSPSVENLNQTTLRNTSETFSQKRERRKDNLFHETDLRRSEENTNEPFSREDTPVENSSNLRGDHVENITDLLAETQNPCSILPYSYERDRNKVFDQECRPTEEKPSIVLHNLQRTSEMLSREEDHHQENLLNMQNLCPALLSTSETLQTESSPSQNLSYSDPQICPPFLGHHVENTNEAFARESIPRGEHLSDVGPNLLDSSVLNISDTLVHEDIPREDGPNLPGNNMEKSSESRDQEVALGEGNLSSDVNNLHPSFSVKDMRESFDEQNPLHEDEHMDECVYSLNGAELPESSDRKNFSPNLFGNIEENPEAFEQEARLKKDILLDDPQNLCPVLFGSSAENSSELFERDDNEGITSPSPDLHTLSTEELASSLLSTSHSEISPRPPECVSCTFPSPPLPAARSSLSSPSDSSSQITSVHAQVCSPASSTAPQRIRAKQSPQSLRDAVSRIRRHTAPDSEAEDEDGDFWESVENTEDDLFNMSEKTGMKEEECVLEERSGYAGNNGKDATKAPAGEERRLGERKDDDDDDDDDDSLSSSSVDSQETVIEGEGKRNILEEDENKQESDLFSEKRE